MKILYLIDIFDSMGGAEKNLCQLVMNINKEKYEPIICCLKGGELANHLKRNNIEVINLSMQRIYSPESYQKIVKLIKIILKEKIKLIVSYHISSDLLGFFLSMVTRVPIISSKRDMGYNLNSRHKFILSFIGKFFDSYISVSNAVKNEVSKINKISLDKIITIYNGIEIEEKQATIAKEKKKKEIGLKKDIPVIGVIAGLRTIKGLRYFIEAAAIVLNNDVHAQFIIVGKDNGEPGCTADDLNRISKRCGISQYVHLLGDRDDINEINQIIDIYVSSSLSEGLSNSILEAMAAGNPVIATNVGGNPEVVINRKTGIIVSPSDSSAIANAVIELLKDKPLFNKMSKTAKEVVRKKYSLNKMIRRNEETYEYVRIKHHKRIQETKYRLYYKIERFSIQGIKLIVASIVYYSGIFGIYNWFKSKTGKSTVKILTYHNISDKYPDYLGITNSVSSFEKQLQELTKYYKIVNLQAAIKILNDKQNYDNSISLTFDDSYRELYTNVFPILNKYKVPAIFFISVNPIQTHMSLMTDIIIFAVNNTSHQILDLSEDDLGVYLLDTKYQKEKAIHDINEKLKRLSIKKRNEKLEYLIEKLEFDINTIDRINLSLNWNDVTTMSKGGMEIGSHTLNHPLLSFISIQDANEEIKRSKEIIEEKTGLKVKYFSYPYGNIESFNEDIIELVKKSGYKGAVTLLSDHSKIKDKFQIPRLSISKGMYLGPFNGFSKSLFHVEISGMSHLLFFRFLRTKKEVSSYDISNV